MCIWAYETEIFIEKKCVLFVQMDVKSNKSKKKYEVIE